MSESSRRVLTGLWIQRVLGFALALTLGLVVFPGCYSGTPYVRPTAVIRIERSLLQQAVEDSAVARGLRIVRSDPESGVVLAVSPIDRSLGMNTRERWRFFVHDEQLSLELHPEARVTLFSHTHWERTEFVCECYRYAREREMLRDIRARVRQSRTENYASAVTLAQGAQ